MGNFGLFDSFNGEKLDLTNASAMFHALQQVPLNREVYTQDEGVLSAGVELITETLSELGNGKLVVFTAYRATNRMLIKKLEKYGVVAVYGEISAAHQVEAIDRFVDDPSCRVILLQLKSGGFGIDRLQSVCSDVMFAEMPLVPAHFHQAVARVWRAGQVSPVNVRVSIAENTIQAPLWDVLQEKDSLVNLCIRGFEDLRDALAGACKETSTDQSIAPSIEVAGEIIDADGDGVAVVEPTIDTACRVSGAVSSVQGFLADRTSDQSSVAVPVLADSEIAHSPISLDTLANKIAGIEASLPALEAHAEKAEKAWKDSSILYMKRITLEGSVNKASNILMAAKAQLDAIAPNAAPTEHDLAIVQSFEAAAAFAVATKTLADFVGPDADTILALTGSKDQASLVLHAAQGEIILARQEMEKLASCKANTAHFAKC